MFFSQKQKTGSEYKNETQFLYWITKTDNYFYCLDLKSGENGTIRETFFESQLSVAHRFQLPQNGDFMIDEKYIFEIGGKNKTTRQIKDLEYVFLVPDDIENGILNQIPLWTFGFLY